jgi:hypothetical protein
MIVAGAGVAACVSTIIAISPAVLVPAWGGGIARAMVATTSAMRVTKKISAFFKLPSFQMFRFSNSIIYPIDKFVKGVVPLFTKKQKPPCVYWAAR